LKLNAKHSLEKTVLIPKNEPHQVMLIKIFDQNTVEPVYNGHPWDLINVAVMQRVI
jgi:hypothetical protein